MTITGNLDPDAFVPWIGRHASKLGVSHRVIEAGRHQIAIDVVGEAELIDMLAIGCSLGPIGVWVEAVDHGGHSPLWRPSTAGAMA